MGTDRKSSAQCVQHSYSTNRKTMALTQIVALACALVSCALSHPAYRDMLPNGYSVPNPCGGGTWDAVGHYDAIHHTHDKNPFGRDFAAAGHSWTVALCQKDSDGDGQTNGEELGDPMCTWTVGSSPSGRATGQPGICEPVGSGACASVSFSCGCHGH